MRSEERGSSALPSPHSCAIMHVHKKQVGQEEYGRQMSEQDVKGQREVTCCLLTGAREVARAVLETMVSRPTSPSLP